MLFHIDMESTARKQMITSCSTHTSLMYHHLEARFMGLSPSESVLVLARIPAAMIMRPL